MKKVDTILNCRWVIPIEPYGVVLEKQAIIIDQGNIVNLLPQEHALQLYQCDQVSQLDEHAVLPGFINAHTHSPMVLFKGLADDLTLMDWLQNHIWPAEAKWLNPAFITDGTEVAIAEMIKNGTTCFNEHYFFPTEILTVVEQTAIRACIGATIINFPTNWSHGEEEGFTQFQRLYETFQGSARIQLSLAPHAPYTISNEMLHRINQFSLDHHLKIHMHVQETAQEVAESIQQYGKRPLQRLHELGLLSERLQCVHMTQINESDLVLLKENKVNVIHCPESNLKLASGYCAVDRLLCNGINVALGTDSAASNNNLDMIGEMRTAALIGKTVACSPTAVAAFDVLRMATLNGARALGLTERIGSITVGKEADIIAINLNHINTLPTYNPVSQIVYSATNTQITDVWVAGKAVLQHGKLLTLDEDKLRTKINKWQQRISNEQRCTVM